MIGGHEDQYNGFICDETTLPSSPSSFKAALDPALASWRQRGYRGIWLKVPADKAHVIGQAVDAGFEFHHAEQVGLTAARLGCRTSFSCERLISSAGLAKGMATSHAVSMCSSTGLFSMPLVSLLQAYVMLTLWLPDTENKLPPNASHQVGVGAVVMNQQREILVVQEGSGPLRGKGVWKMPTGLVQVEHAADWGVGVSMRVTWVTLESLA